jgi:hypothetical protein
MAKCFTHKHVIVAYFCQFQSGFYYNFVLHKKRGEGFTFSISRNISLSLSYHV